MKQRATHYVDYKIRTGGSNIADETSCRKKNYSAGVKTVVGVLDYSSTLVSGV